MCPSALTMTMEAEQLCAHWGGAGGCWPAALGLHEELRSEWTLELSQHLHRHLSEPAALGPDAEGDPLAVLSCNLLGPFPDAAPTGCQVGGGVGGTEDGQWQKQQEWPSRGRRDGGRGQQAVPSEGEPVGQRLGGKRRTHQYPFWRWSRVWSWPPPHVGW